MKIKPYIDRLNKSKEYKKFHKEHEDAFMVAGFFILDLESGKNVHQIDYYIPSEKKIAAFTLDGGVSVQILNTMNASVPEKLDMQTNIDLEAIPGILEDEMKNRSITEEIKKIIAIIQTVDKKRVWNLNCVLSGMEILKAHIEDESETVLKMEKASIMDYVKKMPLGELQKAQAKAKLQNAASVQTAQSGEDEDAENEESEGPIQQKTANPKELKEKLKKLKELETEIEDEEEEAKEELAKEKGVKAIEKEKLELESKSNGSKKSVKKSKRK